MQCLCSEAPNSCQSLAHASKKQFDSTWLFLISMTSSELKDCPSAHGTTAPLQRKFFDAHAEVSSKERILHKWPLHFLDFVQGRLDVLA